MELRPIGYKNEAERLDIQDRRRRSLQTAIARGGYIPSFGECLLTECSPEIEAIWRGLMWRRRKGETAIDVVAREATERNPQ